MSKKKDKRKETLLAETVEMQKKQAMNLVAQSTVNQQTLSCLSKKLTRKSISTMVKLLRSRALFFEKLACLLISTLKNRKHIQVITCSHPRKVSLSA